MPSYNTGEGEVNYCHRPDIVSLCRGLENDKQQSDCKYFEGKTKCTHNDYGNVCKSLKAQLENEQKEKDNAL